MDNQIPRDSFFELNNVARPISSNADMPYTSFSIEGNLYFLGDDRQTSYFENELEYTTMPEPGEDLRIRRRNEPAGT